MKVKDLIIALQKCDPEKNVFISMDVSTGDGDHDHRFFGEILEVVENDTTEVPLLCEKTEQNWVD